MINEFVPMEHVYPNLGSVMERMTALMDLMMMSTLLLVLKKKQVKIKTNIQFFDREKKIRIRKFRIGCLI